MSFRNGCTCPLSRTKRGREVAYKANIYAAMLCHYVPIAPARLEVVERPEVHSSLVALGQPAHHIGLRVVVELECATSPMVLDQQQS